MKLSEIAALEGVDVLSKSDNLLVATMGGCEATCKEAVSVDCYYNYSNSEQRGCWDVGNALCEKFCAL